ncbi:MAG: mechanosensitive ion channel family protein, partial [Geminicoccaceae bacterium]
MSSGNLARAVFGLVLLLGVTVAFAQEGDEAAPPPEPVTLEDTEIRPADLKLLLDPLTRDELAVEAAAWRDTVKAKIVDMNEAELEGRRLLTEAQEAAGGEAGEDGEPVTSEEADAMFERAAALRDERARLLDRLKVVVDEWEAKGADVVEYRQYMTAVSGIDVDVTDARSATKTVLNWLTSAEGGLRILRQIAVVLGTTIVFWFLGGIVSFLVGRGLSATNSGSLLLRQFLRRWVRRVVAFIGLLVGLSAVGINIGPMVAAIGAAGFVIGLALQGTLSNFASGILIMTQRPFDVGDSIDAAGVSGAVEQVTLFSTHVTTGDQRKIIVPNNAIWGGNITNASVENMRRIDFEVDVADSVAIEDARFSLRRALEGHEAVLDDPGVTVELATVDHAESKLCFKANAWVREDAPGNPRLELIERLQAAFPAERL